MTNFSFHRRHHRDEQRRGGHVKGDQILHSSDPGADRRPAQPGRGQQAHQLRGLPEGELRGHAGAMPHQPGEVAHRVVGPQHHLQPPQAGQRLGCWEANVLPLQGQS